MIHRKTKTIFVHIPKTGGSSIETLFTGASLTNRSKRGNNACKCVHDFPAEYKKEWSDYFTFTVVRNPWSRLVSDFYYQASRKVKALDTKRSYRGTAKRLFKEMRDDAFLFFVHNRFRGCFNKCHEHPSSFLKPMNLWFDNSLPYDKVFRQETLDKDLTLCDELLDRGVNVQDIPKINTTKHKHYTEMYDAKAIKIVADAYKEDIERFNYQFGD